MPERPNARRAVPARSRPLTQALVIGRRGKGRPIEEAVRETRKRLEGAGWTVESALEDRKRELRQRAARAVKAEVDVVVAVGGDGAVLQLVQVLAETPVALGIIPKWDWELRRTTRVRARVAPANVPMTAHQAREANFWSSPERLYDRHNGMLLAR